MYCYKCTTTENLSIKTKRPDGTPRLMICKACRRAQHQKWVYAEDKQLPMTDEDAWIKYARDCNKRLAQKYKEVYIIR